MHAESLDSWRHEHVFLGADHARNERRSWAVVALCGAMMMAEIIDSVMPSRAANCFCVWPVCPRNSSSLRAHCRATAELSLMTCCRIIGCFANLLS